MTFKTHQVGAVAAWPKLLEAVELKLLINLLVDHGNGTDGGLNQPDNLHKSNQNSKQADIL